MRYRFDRVPPVIAEEERIYLQESARSELWHQTYNAALNAFIVRGAAECHEQAVIAANLAHGEL